jgi:pyruvate/2-oxoglutarate dehydrogenase complex dihydrolipoamide acyltransferase (E2) component
MILEDFLFKEGKLIKYLLYTTISYWIFYSFVPKTPYQTASKKLAIASYSQSYDPTIYTRMNLETKNAKAFLEKLEKETGKKFTLTLFFAKCAGEIYNKFPEINVAMRFGSLYPKKTVDMAVLVDVEGKVK